jgi:hypothetical protein
MADPLSITASVLGVAGAGIKLATTLYAYSDTAFKADRSVRTIAADVSLTASVLSELGTLLQTDSADHLISVTALDTTGRTVKGCKECFEEIDEAIGKLLGEGKPRKKDENENENEKRRGANSGANSGARQPSGMSVWKRMKWPLMEPHMRLLQSNLDRLKSTLLLMLNVITYARKLSGEYVIVLLFFIALNIYPGDQETKQLNYRRKRLSKS